MEIKDLILLLWRNVRYVVLGLVLGGGLGIIVSIIQTPIYDATTEVFVSQTRQQGSSSILSLSDEQLLAINLQLAKSQPVLDGVSSKLGSKIDADNIQVGAIPNTLIIQIKVQDEDPQKAARIGNLLVETLIQQNGTLLSTRYLSLENSISEEVDQIQKQIDDLQAQISQINDTSIQDQLSQVDQQIEKLKSEITGLEHEIASFPDFPTPLDRITLVEKQAELEQLHLLMSLYQEIQTNLTYIGKPGQNGLSLENPRLTTLQSTLNLYQQINTTLINNRENVRLARTQSGQNVMQIVSATPPKNPVRPIPVLYFLLGIVMGLTLPATAIILIEHLDNSLKSAGQIKELLDLNVLGVLSDDKNNKKGLVTLRDPFTVEAEAYRALGASLDIISTNKNVCTLMIVNAEPTDARTIIAANLAVINAQQGKQVILLDGDLKHPHLHNLFGMENRNGFAELLKDGMDIKSASHVVEDVEGMTLIPSGVVEHDTKGWLDEEKLTRLLSMLHKQTDLVIVDSPSIDAADSQVLASKMDAVLLVIRAGHTRVDLAQTSLRKFQLIGVRVAGAVLLNRKMQNRNVNNKFLTWLKTKLNLSSAGL